IVWAAYAAMHNSSSNTQTASTTSDLTTGENGANGQTNSGTAGTGGAGPVVVSTTNSTTTVITGTNTKSFTIHGQDFSFSPNQISVNKGDTVKITFVSDNGSHDLVVDGYNARTNVLTTGKSQTITFLADKAGSFQFYCSVGNHRQMGMTGTLVVKGSN